MLAKAVIWVIVAGATASSAPPCTCAEASEKGGWCQTHETGYLAAIEIPSRRLFEALDAHGHDVDPESFRCETCREALQTDGFCEEHRIGFRGGQAYFSRLTHVLSGGRVTSDGSIDCPVCRANANDHGWCETHETGMIGNVAISDREEFERAAESIRILHEAIRALERCEHCAVAIQTGTTCPRCRIRYRDGKAVGSAETAP